MRVRLTVSYRGGAYAGWQRQDNALGVQEVLEGALEKVLGRAAGAGSGLGFAAGAERPVACSAASRTDAGVHARGQVVHLAGPAVGGEGDGLPGTVSLRGLVLGTNTHLPEDVRVMAAARVPDRVPDRAVEGAGVPFHARKHAAGKEYRYRLSRAAVVSPLDAPFTVRVDPGLDLEPVRRATERLPGRHDFSAFALAGGAHTSPVRTVREAEWLEEGDGVWLRIVGDGFLRGMVRGLVGTLLEVGAGRRTPEGFARLLDGSPRSTAGPTAPARGLVLERVLYPPEWAPVERWPPG